jgi:hypothetical protein
LKKKNKKEQKRTKKNRKGIKKEGKKWSCRRLEVKRRRNYFLQMGKDSKMKKKKFIFFMVL